MDDLKFQELLDKEAIREVRYRWAEGLDTQNWELITSLMTEEVDADFRSMGLPAQKVPREILVQNFQNNLSRPGLKTQHLFSNARVTVNSDSATCKSNFIGQHFLQGFAGGAEFYLRGEYDDALTRTPDGWKISGMKFTLFYVSGNPNLLAS